jgi:hypothetical protein
VGVLLMLALVVGAWAATLLLRAAHGRPSGASIDAISANSSDDPEADAEQAEAGESAQALEAGVRLAFACAALLVAAVGMTWYGPAKEQPAIAVVTRGGERCGKVVKVAGGDPHLEDR